MLKTFYVWFGICFFCYAYRTVFHILNNHGLKAARTRAAVSSVFVVMFVLWFSWFQMCLLDPTILPVPGWIRGLGLFLFVAGVFLFVFSHTKMKGFEGRGVLIKTGIYSRIRNPMYLGFIIWIIGFPLFMRKMLSSLSSVIWIVHILVWKFLEEKELEKKYPEYGEYKARTWF